MKEISASQKKIIVIAAIAAAAFLLFYFVIYYPAKDKEGRVRQELSGIEAQIKTMESIISNAKTMEESINELGLHSQKLNSKFPQKEEDGLKMLSDLAPALNIEIISTRPEAKSLFLDEKSQKVEIEGKVCRKVFVSIEMKGAYQDLVKYLEKLTESLPAFISIENLKISKDNPAASKLNIILDLNLYLLS